LGGQATSIDVVQNIIKYLQETTKTSNWLEFRKHSMAVGTLSLCFLEVVLARNS